jgi:predicted phosphoribosyltransferase
LRQNNVELDIIICKQIGAENNPELAIGAVMADGIMIVFHKSIKPVIVLILFSKFYFLISSIY